jgi:hypothetical protein
MMFRRLFMGPDGARASAAPLVIALVAMVAAVIVTSRFWSLIAVTLVLSVAGSVVYVAFLRLQRHSSDRRHHRR